VNEKELNPFILVVDDEPDIRRLVREILEDEGYSVAAAKDGAAAKVSIEDHEPDLILLDIWMPDIDGITLLKEIIDVYHLPCPVIMMSGHGTVEAAVESTRLGAFDFIEKPISLSKLLLTVEKALANKQATQNQSQYTQTKIEFVDLIGKSQVVTHLRNQLERCSQFDVTVLLNGEHGVGKAHCARFIHTHSKRKDGPFLTLQTASFSSFQGAELLLGRQTNGNIKKGFLEKVSGGTLYIDDVTALNEELQSVLYGVLNSPTIYRVNGDEPLTIDMRLIVGTRFDLEQEIKTGRITEELYYSIVTYPIHIPPLNEHNEDISELLQYYVNYYTEQEGQTYRSFTLAAQNRLRNYGWPGNIKELENFVHRTLINGGDTSIDLDEVEALLESHTQAQTSMSQQLDGLTGFDLPLRQAREQYEKAYLTYHLGQSEGSVGKVAKLAGMERTHLYRKLRSLGIDAKQIVQSGKE